MKKTRKAAKPEFITRSIHRKDKTRRWSLAAGVIFCALALVSFIRLENISIDDEVLHRSACENEIVPIYLSTQGSFVPDEVIFDINFAPEAVEVVEFFANKNWTEKSRLEGDGALKIILEIADRQVERDFATVYLRVKSDNIVKYEITEKSGKTELVTGHDEVLKGGC